jgi:outer membrane protein assembly factor BamB
MIKYYTQVRSRHRRVAPPPRMKCEKAMAKRIACPLQVVLLSTCLAALPLAQRPERPEIAAPPAERPGGQWGGSSLRNNAPVGEHAPVAMNGLGQVDAKLGWRLPLPGSNVKWTMRLGTQTYGTPIVAGGKVFIGTNNGAGYLARYPDTTDLGCLLCLHAETGNFLWQLSCEKLPTGLAQDWPFVGLCSTPLVEGDRLWCVTNRGEVVCLDSEGFLDGEDDGPDQGVNDELFSVTIDSRPGLLSTDCADLLREEFARAGAHLPNHINVRTVAAGQRWDFSIPGLDGDVHFTVRLHQGRLYVSRKRPTKAPRKDEADVVWSLDMMKDLGVSQHNMATCSPTAWKDTLFVCTSNGVDVTHEHVSAPFAPSFLALDKRNGSVRWTDRSPGDNILHGQWSSPAAGLLGGVPQVIFGGGDGWLYSFHAEEWDEGEPYGRPRLLWRFDCNPKDALYSVSGRSTRNHIMAIPVIHDGLVYVAVGEDPEHGEGNGHLWCIDPTHRGDVSPQLAVHRDAPRQPLPHNRLQAVSAEKGEIAIDNPNSAVVWHYREFDWDGDGKIADFEERMHRTISSVAIQDNLLVVPDFSGLLQCLDAKTGRAHWTYDLFACTWSSPLIVDGKIYVGDEEGKVSIFGLSADPNCAMTRTADGSLAPLHVLEFPNSITYSAPVVVNDVLYIATKTELFAIGAEAKQGE